MLVNIRSNEISFIESVNPAEGYRVDDPRIEILDSMNAKFSATLTGPEGSRVIGRAWISDEDGTMAESDPIEVEAGSRIQLKVKISDSKAINGRMIACIRIEYPLFDTKHVVQADL